VPGAYIDEGAHGKALVRPALWQMIEDARARLFDIVLVYRGDRLSRQIHTKRFLVAALTQLGIRIVAGDNLTGDLTLEGIQAVLGASELAVLKERTKAGVRRAAETKWVGRVPVGFEPSGKTVVPTQEALDLRSSDKSPEHLLRTPEAVNLNVKSVTALRRMFANLRAYESGRLDRHLERQRASRERRISSWERREDQQEKELLKRLIDIIPSIRDVL